MTHQIPIHQGQSIDILSCLFFSMYTYTCEFTKHERRICVYIYRGKYEVNMTVLMTG